MLVDHGHRILGIDNLNADYDVRLKDYRLGRLLNRRGMAVVLGAMGYRFGDKRKGQFSLTGWGVNPANQ